MSETLTEKLSSKFSRLEKVDIIALSFCAIVFLFWFNLLSLKYYKLGYYDWDLALYSNTMWNLAHGSFHTSLFGTTHLINHAQYFAIILTPIYIIFQHPLTLIFLKVLSFVTGAFILYGITKRAINRTIAFSLLVLYVIYPANIFMLLFEFQFENLAICFIFLLYYFFFSEKLVAFTITAILAAMIKENISLLIIPFGIYAFFMKREKKKWWVILPIVIGAGIFCLTMLVITPALRINLGIEPNQYLALYRPNIPAESSFLQALFISVQSIFVKLFSVQNFNYLRDLCGPLNVLPFLSPHILFLALPIFLQNMLSSAYQMHTIFFHYAATIVPYMFLATVHSLKFLTSRVKTSVLMILIGFVTLACVGQSVFYTNAYKSKAGLNNPLAPLQWEMIDQIPKNAPVIASYGLMDPLSQRKSLYSFSYVWEDIHRFTGESPFKLPDDVSYALLNLDDPWIWNFANYSSYENNHRTFSNIRNFFMNDNWSVVKAVEGTILFEKNLKEGQPLVEVSRKPFKSPKSSLNVSIDGNLQLLACKIKDTTSKSTTLLPMTFYWKSLKNTQENFTMILGLQNKGDWTVVRQKRIGYAINPTMLWNKGDYIKEDYWLTLPRLKKGQHDLFASVINAKTGQAATAYQKNNEPVKNNMIYLGTVEIH